MKAILSLYSENVVLRESRAEEGDKEQILSKHMKRFKRFKFSGNSPTAKLKSHGTISADQQGVELLCLNLAACLKVFCLYIFIYKKQQLGPGSLWVRHHHSVSVS